MKCCGTVIATAYRPPSGDFREFHLFVSKVLQCVTTLGLSIVLIGDFNINLLLANPQTQRFIDVIESFNCVNTIKSPTRITANTGSLIDLCITNHDVADVLSGILTLDVSDHLPIFVFIPRPKRRNCRTHDVPLLSRNFNSEALDSFRSMVDSIDWVDVCNESDPSLSYDIFLYKIKCSYDIAFPLHQVKGHKKSRKPWVTRELYKRIKRGIGYLMHLFISKTKRHSRNIKNSDLRKARAQCYKDMFVSISNNPKKIWTAIRRLQGNPNSLIPSTLIFDNAKYTDSSLATKFNDHFLQTGVTNTIPTYSSTKDLNGYVSLDSTNSVSFPMQ